MTYEPQALFQYVHHNMKNELVVKYEGFVARKICIILTSTYQSNTLTNTLGEVEGGDGGKGRALGIFISGCRL